MLETLEVVPGPVDFEKNSLNQHYGKLVLYTKYCSIFSDLHISNTLEKKPNIYSPFHCLLNREANTNPDIQYILRDIYGDKASPAIVLLRVK